MLDGRIVGHVQQMRAVLIGAKHVGGDEAGAGIVAFVAQYAIEFQRMADRFVNLQHHLIGHQ